MITPYFNSSKTLICKLVGAAIRKLRNATGKSLRIFAYENDISRSTLSCAEIGSHEVGLATIKKIAEGFDLSMPEFFHPIDKNIPSDFKIIDL